MRTRFGFTLLLLLGLILPVACDAAQSDCQLSGTFALLHSEIPDRVGICSGSQLERPELGEATQPTSNGVLTYHTIDQVVSFSDGTSDVWVLDPNGQAHMRGLDERFPWEFNGDGFPLVGQSDQQVNGVCPTPPEKVLAVENFYASLANQIGGQCVVTTTILSDPDADPHEFQPTATGVRAFQSAQLVIENGLGYDDFADKVLATMQTPLAVVKSGDVLNLQTGANPHVWYSARYVDQVRAAILANLKAINPEAGAYYDAQSVALDQRFTTYHDLVNRIASTYANVPVGATESIFVDMASTAGLNLVSPPEFMRALSEGNDPTARDLAVFENQINNHQIKVLVYNTQTVTNVTEQLKAMAQQNDIPIVGVSETMPVGAQTFQGWQSSQLELLLLALQKSTGTT